MPCYLSDRRYNTYSFISIANRTFTSSIYGINLHKCVLKRIKSYTESYYSIIHSQTAQTASAFPFWMSEQVWLLVRAYAEKNHFIISSQHAQYCLDHSTFRFCGYCQFACHTMHSTVIRLCHFRLLHVLQL